MKIFNKLLTIVLFVTILAGCSWFEDDKNSPKPEDKYLLDYKWHKTYSAVTIKNLINQASLMFPEVQSLADQVEHKVSVYTIRYITKFNGEDIIASGLVAIPDTKNVDFPLMSYQNGTNTLHSQAPSVNPDNELFLLLETVASTGFVIALPDYLGFGASSNMFHPYLHKESTVQTVTDMLRAVKELCGNYLEIGLSDDLYLTGYSQGGWATMQVQKAIELENASEFDLKASACGAGPYDLNFINRYVLEQSSYPMPYFIGYIFNSYFNLGIPNDLASEVFNAPYASRILTLYDGTKSGDEINAQLSTKISELFTDNYRKNYTDDKFKPLISSLSENSVEAWKTTIPTLILHGTKDDFVPPQVSENIVQKFRSLGIGDDLVTFKEIPGATHTTGIIPSGIASVNWLIEIKNTK